MVAYIQNIKGIPRSEEDKHTYEAEGQKQGLSCKSRL